MNWIAFMRANCRLLILAASAAAGGSQSFAGQISTSPLALRSFEHLGWTAADFDGDSQPDVAITEVKGRNSYVLSIRLSTNVELGARSQQADLPVPSSSTLGLHITPRDVDGDHDLDIV